MLRLPDPLFFLPFIVFDLMLRTQIDSERVYVDLTECVGGSAGLQIAFICVKLQLWNIDWREGIWVEENLFSPTFNAKRLFFECFADTLEAA